METLGSRHINVSLYDILRWIFGVIMIVVGVDKFASVLTNWEGYLDPSMVSILPFTPHVFIQVVGITEIIAGMIVLTKPSIGGYIAAIWLIIISIIMIAGGT